ncbi:hypothetical protein [Pseudomonas syringae]|uniref:hypothetical protein n=1 Tax=Pseudomonas syringae TaxID=317 RepID=UPI001F0730CF|nr:hypothetical protein [Pseudomonas syringae]
MQIQQSAVQQPPNIQRIINPDGNFCRIDGRQRQRVTQIALLQGDERPDEITEKLRGERILTHLHGSLHTDGNMIVQRRIKQHSVT